MNRVLLSSTRDEKQLSIFKQLLNDPKLVYGIRIGFPTCGGINFTGPRTWRNTMFLFTVDNKIVRFPLNEMCKNVASVKTTMKSFLCL